MAETITVTVPELPLVSAPNGDELIAVWDQGRLSRIPQGALRGTRTYSGFGDPPATPSEIMALSPVPVLDDRWRNPETGDEWKVTSLDPFVWTPDGNVKGADGASTVPGPPGAPGERGATGPSGRTLTKTAGETIPDWRAVILDTNGQFRLADPSNPTHRQRVVGVVPYGGSGLATLVAQTAGDVTGPASNFNPAAALFVGSGGLLTSTPPTSGWRQIVATAVSSSQIVVALGEARVVADEGTALILPAGGFAGPCALSQGAVAGASGYVTPSANARAFIATMAGIVPDELPPRRAQFLLALEARQTGSIQALLDALPSSPADPINIAWFHTVAVSTASRLARFAKDQLALSDATLATVLASARFIQD